MHDQNKHHDLEVEQLENRMMLSTVQIFAAGATGQEQLDLFIDQSYVNSYLNVGGDVGNRDFQEFTYQTSETLTADQIGIAFGNDLYDPNSGFDRNLVVDRIVIDGVTYQTEDPTVHSTGIWRNGLTGPGFFQTEIMNINAIFTFSNDAVPDGTRFSVSASGETGEEILEVLVGGQQVAEFGFEGRGFIETFTFEVDGNLDISDFRIQFSNDLYDPSNNFDRNINVFGFETIRSDGSTQLANPDESNVYSEGVWRSIDGFQNGFGRGIQLFTNGFMEVRDSFGGDGDLVLDQSFANNGLDDSSTLNLDVGLEDGRIATSRLGEITIRNFDGSLNTDFGGDGIVDLADLIGDRIGFVPGQGNLRVSDLDLLQDGSLLTVGYLEPADFDTGSTPFIAKLTAQGTLDPTFAAGLLSGPDLQLPTRVFSGPIRADIDLDGNVVIAGKNIDEITNSNSERNPNFVISRLTSDGILDTSFGNNGNVFLDQSLFAGSSEVVEVEVTINDEIHVVVSDASFGSTIIKLNADGSLNTGFSDDGLFYTNQTGEFDGGVQAVEFEIDSQGRIVLGGIGYRFTRVTANGNLDTSFGDNGESRISLDPPITLLGRDSSSFFLDDFVLDDQDRILAFSGADRVIVGRAGAPTVIESAGTVAFRLDDSGSLDSSFNEVGYTIIEVGQGGQSVDQVALDSDGNIVVTGLLYTATDRLGTDPSVVRLRFV